MDEDEEDIRLIDWGESFRRGKKPEELSQPVDIKAPEIIFADKFDYRVDLWSAGLVVRLLVAPLQEFCADELVDMSHAFRASTFRHAQERSQAHCATNDKFCRRSAR